MSNLIIDKINPLFSREEYEPFLYPVDLYEYPDYVSLIGKPIDLTLVVTRLKNNHYRTLEVFWLSIHSLVASTI